MELNLPPKAESALNRLQDTNLSPMEEALFQAWTKANQIADPDNPNDFVDYRGLYMASRGAVLPNGELKRMTEEQNASTELEKALQERMLQRMEEMAGKQEDMANQQFKAERQDITHKQKMEQGQMKLKQLPFDLRLKKHDLKGKTLDLDKQKLGLKSQELDNQGKEIDMVSALLQPARAGVEAGALTTSSGGDERSQGE